MGNILKKIRQHGLKWCIERYWGKYINYFVSFILSKIIPIDEKCIAFESEGDLTDNAYALFYFLRESGYLKDYKVIWLVDNIKSTKNYPEVTPVIKKPIQLNIERDKLLSSASLVIYDHCNPFEEFVKRNGQRLIFLSHGCGYKSSKGGFATKRCMPDEMYVLSKHYSAPMSEWSGIPIERMIDIGSPRLDWFFKNSSSACQAFKEKNNLNMYSKIIFWMPTFRQSIRVDLDENYIENETGLPLINTYKELHKLNDFLEKSKCLIILKIHHLQALLPVFSEKYSNILFLQDADLANLNVQLYQLLTMTDGLITDYSSIGNDYLLLNKPIIYTIDDYESYAEGRGFYKGVNILDTMKGSHVGNELELENAIGLICSGHDEYKCEREEWCRVAHAHLDGCASYRIGKHLGIID